MVKLAALALLPDAVAFGLRVLAGDCLAVVAGVPLGIAVCWGLFRRLFRMELTGLGLRHAVPYSGYRPDQRRAR